MAISVNRLRDVDALPAGCSPHGVCDAMCNTWEMSDEFSDQHTRSVVLLGGSGWTANSAGGVPVLWYFPPVQSLEQHGKYFLYSDGYERSSTVGFRCVADRVPSGL